jgi:hypothetical protein
MRPSAAALSTLLWLVGLGAFAASPTPEQVAHRILYDANGRPTAAVFDAALRAKFPVGSSLSGLADFFRELGGFCASRNDGVTFRCEVDIETCSFTIIARVEATDDVIAKLQHLQLAQKTCD